MANVLLLTTATTKYFPYARRDYERLLDAANYDRFGIHHLCNEPEKADIILFVSSTEPDLRDVRVHEYVKRFPDKCFLHHTGDQIIPFLRGIYPSIEKRWYRNWWCRSGFYPRVFDHYELRNFDGIRDARYLFSFVGAAANAQVRRQILRLEHSRGLIQDSAMLPEQIKGQFYLDTLRDSKFILCPRGGGTSSFRLFESMKAGRIPVILSDEWVPPEGPDWDACSVRIKERDVKSLPEILAALEPDAERMGSAAHAEWNKWFSKDVAFHRIVNWCLDLTRTKPPCETTVNFYVGIQTFRPIHFRHSIIGALKRRLISS